MKKKLNRVLSALLLCVMLFSSLSVCLPLVASAATSQTFVDEQKESKKDAATVLSDALQKDRTAMEAWQHDYNAGYLDYYTNGDYAIFVNRYTGLLYYVNLVTGQVLTSNPTDPNLAAKESDSAKKLYSQILITLFENANTSVKHNFDSASKAAEKGQISVSPIKNGLRVNYAIGDTANRYLLPNMMTVERFNELFLKEFVSVIQRQWVKDVEVVGDTIEGVTYMYASNDKAKTEDGNYDQLFVMKYIGVVRMLLTNASVRQKAADMYALLQKYSFNQELGVYVLEANLSNKAKAECAKQLHSLCPEYDFNQMYTDEAEAGYVQQVEAIPVLRCAIEYTLNDDGSLQANLPANSIVYDETYYTLSQITVLPYFGAGDMTKDGYLFYPDGSGMVLDFSDFVGQTFSLINNIFGNDSAFSKLDEAINKRGERVTMPVYGIVNEQIAPAQVQAATGKETVTNGFFAILEGGSSMATLTYAADGAVHSYVSAYPTYRPYPSDVYDLSQTISVGNLGEYIIVSDSKYTGDCATRFVMLTDPDLQAVAEAGEQKFYAASYVGMANYYRDYLKANGTLSAMEGLTSDVPLYIETFGAMDILDRFLTFPVTKSIPLTTFDNVGTMYKELSADGVENIVFRLTGFANGGMEYTYPVKSRWENACGGSRDFEELLALAKSLSTGNKSFALYPEFDFMYINNVALFDGISEKGNVSCMVDNRYASKQIYNSVLVDEKKGTNILVISPDALADLFAKFLDKYKAYDIKNVSVSTIGTDLNSNFDDENSINREQAKDYVSSVLETMSKKYNLMMDGGNEYTLKYASHLLNIATDSSHYRFSSYTVPFVGMILHSYVSYAGTPLNYAGNMAYDELRAIESGAAPYYILVYQNTEKLKENASLSRYYGVNYATWKSSVVESYKYINGAIGSLQTYEISDHRILTAERVWDAEEAEKNLVAQEKLFFEEVKVSINERIAETIATMQKGQGLKVTIDRNELIGKFAAAAHMEATDERLDSVKAEIDAFCLKIEGNYDGTAADGNAQNFVSLVIDSIADIDFSFYVTNSEATAGADYQATNYTVDNGNVVMVTYSKGTEKVVYILNYNSYSVTVRMNGKKVLVGSYSYEPYEEV